MALRVKVDEDLPTDVLHLLTERGCDASSVYLQGWSGFADTDLWQRIQQEDRWLITGDVGFADVRYYRPNPTTGIVLLRPVQESRRAYAACVGLLLDRVVLEDHGGSIIVATHADVRIRRTDR